MAEHDSTDSLIQRLENILGDISRCRVVVDQLTFDRCESEPCHIPTLELVALQLTQSAERMNGLVRELTMRGWGEA